MKKLGILALLISALGVAVLGCEPAKKKTETTKSTETTMDMPKTDGAAPSTTETTTETKTEEKPAEPPK